MPTILHILFSSKKEPGAPFIRIGSGSFLILVIPF
nr:MAG TPA: hypothetical protein [Caudoviricetes sp.]